MSFVNALLAIQVNQVEAFLDNWRFDANGNRLANDFAPYQTNPDTPAIDVYDEKDCVPPLTTQGAWKVNDSGAQPLQLVSMYVADKTELDWTDPQDPDPGTVLTVVHYLRETFPGAVAVLDCFKKNGLRHGQEFVYTENGTKVIDVYETQRQTSLQPVQTGTDENGDPIIEMLPVTENVEVLIGTETVPNFDESIGGQPTYPPVAKGEMLNYMPDDDGGVPATDYKEVNNLYLWRPRIYE